MDTQIDKPSAPAGQTSGDVNPNTLHNPAREVAKPKSNYRWVVCSMLVFATTVNYMDRQILGLLAPMLQKDIGWTQMEYSWLVNAFTVAYGVGTLVCGRIIDKLGPKSAMRWRWWSGAPRQWRTRSSVRSPVLRWCACCWASVSPLTSRPR